MAPPTDLAPSGPPVIGAFPSGSTHTTDPGSGRSAFRIFAAVVGAIALVAAGFGLVLLVRPTASTSTGTSDRAVSNASGSGERTGSNSGAGRPAAPSESGHAADQTPPDRQPSDGGAKPDTGTATPAVPVSAPTLSAVSASSSGRHVKATFTAAHASSCTGSYKGHTWPTDCSAGTFEIDADYGTTAEITITAHGDGGDAEPKTAATAVPLLVTPVIHAAFPPPPSRIPLHPLPDRWARPTTSVTFADGELVTVQCWVQGTSHDGDRSSGTVFVYPGRADRYSAIFYKVLDNYMWAPFLTDDIEAPIPGVLPC